MAARLLAALSSTEADKDEGVGALGMDNLEVPHLLGMLKMDGSVTVQETAAEHLAQEVSKAVSLLGGNG